jgi:hypothetical protein
MQTQTIQITGDTMVDMPVITVALGTVFGVELGVLRRTFAQLLLQVCTVDDGGPRNAGLLAAIAELQEAFDPRSA